MDVSIDLKLHTMMFDKSFMIRPVDLYRLRMCPVVVLFFFKDDCSVTQDFFSAARYFHGLIDSDRIFLQRGFDDESLGTIFSHSVLGNSLVAIVAGLIAQQFADLYGFV